jgi:NAD(P)-dependent dehydrogenase (short-subunit alcohol dehydrogenase family)
MNVIVTGASGALGAAVVDGLQRKNHAIVLIDRIRSGCAHPERELVADLTDSKAAGDALAAAEKLLPHVDGLVHLVGQFRWMPFSETPSADWRQLFSVNVETAVNTIQATLPRFSDGGAIVCIGAASAQPARAGMAAYAAAKSGLARVVEALADELKPRRIRVNAVAPAIIDTPRNRAENPTADPSQWTSPQAVADVVNFLLSSDARAINGVTIMATNNG